ncbi:MAG: hypothetical protein RSE14_06710 [Erythrobacter sp.]|jgi:hypothetical protein|uniref:hypothetical protein n=1 Tax=Erythrobacter sp. TaxID=1042 RepID=UPI002B48E32C|nr:hypothetical protein [Erythrobacter sp.]WRH71771.1 MAG: hypothetical protein RSE14_06710 [Erythrobacter sp.]
MLMLMLARVFPVTPSVAEVENAREEGGRNCAPREDMVAGLKKEQYFRTRTTQRIAGYRVELWENFVPDEERRPDRARFVYVRHTDEEDCLIRTSEQ